MCQCYTDTNNRKQVINMTAQTQEITTETLHQQTQVLLEQRDEVLEVLGRATQMKAEIDAELTRRCLETASKSLMLISSDRIVKMITMRDFKQVPLDFADRYSATQIVVNTKILKALADSGVDVPGIKEREQLYVK